MNAVILARIPPAPLLPKTDELAAAENDAHAFLACLKQNQDDKQHAHDNMQGENQSFHNNSRQTTKKECLPAGSGTQGRFRPPAEPEKSQPETPQSIFS